MNPYKEPTLFSADYFAEQNYFDDLKGTYTGCSSCEAARKRKKSRSKFDAEGYFKAEGDDGKTDNNTTSKKSNTMIEKIKENAKPLIIGALIGALVTFLIMRRKINK